MDKIPESDLILSKPNENKTIKLLTQSDSLLGSFIINDDGYYVFFPEDDGGYYNEWFLTYLLAVLENLNAEWDSIVQGDIGNVS